VPHPVHIPGLASGNQTQCTCQRLQPIAWCTVCRRAAPLRRHHRAECHRQGRSHGRGRSGCPIGRGQPARIDRCQPTHAVLARTTAPLDFWTPSSTRLYHHAWRHGPVMKCSGLQLFAHSPPAVRPQDGHARTRLTAGHRSSFRLNLAAWRRPYWVTLSLL